jgi:hypothetical protein
MAVKNSNDTIGNRTRDLPPQPTAPPRVPLNFVVRVNGTQKIVIFVRVALHTANKNMAVLGLGQFKIKVRVLGGNSHSCSD